MSDEDLKLKIGSPTVLDKALEWSRNKPLSEEELKGFVKKCDFDIPSVVPYFKILTPDAEDGQKGYGFVIGIKGSF